MRSAFFYSDRYHTYDFGPRHPLRPERYQRTVDLLRGYEAFSEDAPLLEPRPATDADLSRVHQAAYVDAVHRLSVEPDLPIAGYYGFGPGDNPAFAGMFEAAALFTGGTLAAAECVVSGHARTAFNVAGGLHHAMPARASGFCIFNDCAAGISRLLDSVQRVAYVDIDAHHGDGVQAIFYRNSRVLTISLHESGEFLFPQTGFVDELGESDARGTALNVPLFPGTDDAVFLEAFHAVVPEAIDRFAPDVLVTPLGGDAHFSDPLAHLMLTTAAYEQVLGFFKRLDVPWIATGGGGYNVPAVTRIWALAWGILAGVELPDTLPSAYAAVFGPGTLRDHEQPEVSADSHARARRYARLQVDLLRRAVF